MVHEVSCTLPSTRDSYLNTGVSPIDTLCVYSVMQYFVTTLGAGQSQTCPDPQRRISWLKGTFVSVSTSLVSERGSTKQWDNAIAHSMLVHCAQHTCCSFGTHLVSSFLVEGV